MEAARSRQNPDQPIYRGDATGKLPQFEPGVSYVIQAEDSVADTETEQGPPATYATKLFLKYIKLI